MKSIVRNISRGVNPHKILIRSKGNRFYVIKCKLGSGKNRFCVLYACSFLENLEGLASN